MITKIQKLKNFGNFQDFEWDIDLQQFNEINIIYGYNGSGKTTISNLFYLLSKNCLNKEELLKEYLLKDTEIEIIQDGKKINEKNLKNSDLDIYIFNTKFINDHVYDGTVANIAPFSNDIKLTNDVINEIDKRISILYKRKDKLDNWLEILNKIFDTISKNYIDEFNKKISGSRLTNMPTIFHQLLPNPPFDFTGHQNYLIGVYSDYNKKEKEEEIKDTLNIILEKSNSINSININLVDINSHLSFKVNVEARKIIHNRIIEIQKLVSSNKELKKIEVLDHWYQLGKDLLDIKNEHDKKCPLCNSDISQEINLIINDYANYFTKEITELNNYLDNLIQTLENYLNSVIDNNSNLIVSIINILNKNNYELDIADFESSSYLKSEIKDIITVLKNKRNDLNNEFSIKEISIKTIKEYLNYLEQLNINKFIENELKKLSIITKTQNIDIIKQTIKEIISIEFNLFENTIFKNSKKTNSQIANKINSLKIDIQKELDRLNINRNNEIIKLKAESKFINLYLDIMGINKFIVDNDINKSKENIIITYSTGSIKKTLKFSLSESEKTALAFAYFLSKIRVEKLENNNGFNNIIFVIDDPVSSFDENRLFQTANIINSFFFYNNDSNNSIPMQFFLLSHNINFLKYFNSSIKSNPDFDKMVNEFYISPYETKIIKLPNGFRNFTNTYIVKLNDIIDYKENKSILLYEEARKFIPNYIRLVLETFLSFKLANVKNSRGNLPGLKHLIELMIKELNVYPDGMIAHTDKKGCIKHLYDLKKISDFESHGNISKLEDVNYISENELKEFCKKTIIVIEYLDKIHFNKVKGMN